MQSTQLSSSCRPCKSEYVYCCTSPVPSSPEDKMAARPTKSPVFRDSTNRDSEPYSLSQSLQRQPEEVHLRPWDHGTTWEQLGNNFGLMIKCENWSNDPIPSNSYISLPKPFQHSVWFSVWFSVLSACIFSLYHPWCVFATRILDCRNSRVHSWHMLAQPTLTQLTQLIHLISQLCIKLQVTALNLARPVGARILYLKRLATSPIFRTDCFGKWQDKWVCLKIGYPI